MQKLFSLLIGLVLFSSLHAQDDCDFELTGFAIDCEEGFSFILNDVAFDASIYFDMIEWDFGDGTIDTASPYIALHTYDTLGLFDVTATVLLGNCADSVFTFPISVEECACPTDLDSLVNQFGPSQCSEYTFLVQGYYLLGEGIEFQWDYGDGMLDTTSFNAAYHTYAEEGDYTVTCYYEAPWCPEGTELTSPISVEFCEENCLDSLSFTYDLLDTCGQLTLGIETDLLPVWTYNESVIGEGSLFETELPEGIQEVCATLDAQLGCPLGSEQCFEVDVDCTVVCEATINQTVNLNANCLTSGSLTAVDLPLGSTFYWTQDGDTLSEISTTLNYLFTDVGPYELCFHFSSPDCPEEVSQCILIEVEGCIICPEQENFLAAVSEDTCATWDFQIETMTPGANVTWDFGDGTIIEGGTTISHTFPGDGTYEVSAFYTSEDCLDGVTLIQEIEIEDCLPCPIFVDYEVNFDCLTVSFEWDYEPIGEEFYETTFDFGDGEEVLTEDLNYTFTFSDFGAYEINSSFFSESCGTEEAIDDFTLVLTPDCNEDCSIDILAVNDSCGFYTFTAGGFEESSIISWEINGFIIEEDSTATSFQFLTETTYNVCASYLSEACEDEVITCLEINPELCDPCTLEIDSVMIDCLTYSFSAEVNDDNFPVVWYNEEDSVATGFDIELFFEDQGNVDICAVYTSPACPNGIDACIDLDVDCGDFIGENVIQFKRLIYPNPTDGFCAYELENFTGVLNFEIYNFNGELVYIQEVKSNRSTFDFTSFSSGIYWIKCQTSQGVYVDRVQVIR